MKKLSWVPLAAINLFAAFSLAACSSPPPPPPPPPPPAVKPSPPAKQDTSSNPSTGVPAVSNGGAAGGPSPASTSGKGMGINLAEFKDYSSELPVADVYKISRNIDPDYAGRPRSLVFDTIKGHYPGGDYLITWEGQGNADGTANFDVDGDADDSNMPIAKGYKSNAISFSVKPSNNGFTVAIGKQTNKLDPVKNVHVWMPGYWPPAGADGKPVPPPEKISFYKPFLDRLSHFSVLRFMDWEQTNNNKPSALTWNNRPQVGDDHWTGPYGVPIEVMCDLCNQLGASPWFTVPHQADENYIRQFAQLVHQKLNPNLKIYVEYSNECWNGGFDQHDYCQAQGLAQGLGVSPDTKQTDNFLATIQYYSTQAVRVSKIFKGELGSRVVAVMGSQAGVSFVSDNELKFQNASDSVDALAIAPYFGAAWGNGSSDPSENNIKQTLSMNQASLLNSLKSEINSPDQNLGWIQAQAKIAKQYKVDLIAYESGQSLAGYYGGENNDAVTSLFTQTNRAQEMYDLYVNYYNNWFNNGGKLLNVFNDVSPYDKFGSWGAVEYQDQATSPKWQAVLERAKQFGK